MISLLTTLLTLQATDQIVALSLLFSPLAEQSSRSLKVTLVSQPSCLHPLRPASWRSPTAAPVPVHQFTLQRPSPIQHGSHKNLGTEHGRLCLMTRHTSTSSSSAFTLALVLGNTSSVWAQATGGPVMSDMR